MHFRFLLRPAALITIVAAITGLSAAAPTKNTASKSLSVRWQPERIVNGAPIVFRITPPVHLRSLSGKWFEHDVFFNYDATTKSWYGIAGVSLETAPGTYVLTLKGTTAAGKEISFQKKLRVRAAKYPTVAVTVAPKFTEPSPEQLQQIEQDKVLKQEIFQHLEPQQEWSGTFRAPVDASISGVFGTRRTFNGKVESTHQGLDFAVPQGTPVSALNAGTVLLARPMYFEGNCVFLDHGQGLFTLYLHFSEIKVKEGEHVKAGQELGLSGATGRATGPHLHIAVRWQGIYLNPATLLELKFP